MVGGPNSQLVALPDIRNNCTVLSLAGFRKKIAINQIPELNNPLIIPSKYYFQSSKIYFQMMIVSDVILRLKRIEYFEIVKVHRVKELLK